MEEPSAVVRAIAFCMQAAILGIVVAGMAWRALRSAGEARPWAEIGVIALSVGTSIYCHLHYGTPFVWMAGADNAAQATGLLATLAADSALLAIGARINLAALRAHAPGFLREGLTQWMVGLLIASVAYIVLTSAQIQADDAIRTIVRIPPDRLPDAQRELAVAFAAYGWSIALCIIGCVAALFAMRHALGQVPSLYQRSGRAVASAAPLALALIYAGPAIDLLSKSDVMVRAEQAVELSLILDGAFSSNSASSISGGALICKNLPPDAHIAFVVPDEPVPTKVLEATLLPQATLAQVIASFRLVRCDTGVKS